MFVPVTSYILLSAKHVASLFVMAARETPRRLWNAGLLLVLLLQLSAASDQPPVQVVAKSTTPTDSFTTANSVEDLAFTKGITSLTAVKKDVGEQQSELPVRTTIAPLNVTPVSSASAQNSDTTQVAEKGDTSTATVLFRKLVKLKISSADADSTDKPTTDDNLMFDTKDVVGTNLIPTKDDGEEYNFEKEYEMTSKSKDTLGRADTHPETSNKEPADVHYESDANDYEFKTDEDSHFFLHLVLAGLLVIMVYITYHNKRKIFLLIQKRRWRDSLCSKNLGYRRLNQNVNEAMPSLKRINNYKF